MYNHKIRRLFIYVSNESSPCLNETVILYFRKPIRFLYFAISFSTALKSDIRHCQFRLPAFPGVFIFQYIHQRSKFSSHFSCPLLIFSQNSCIERIAIMDINFRNCSVPSQLRAKMHKKSPSVMAFWLVCLGILTYSCQNTSRDSGY